MNKLVQYFNVIKKGVAAIGGVNYLFKNKAGIKIQTIFRAIIGFNVAGIKISQAPFRLLMNQKPAFKIITFVNGFSKKEIINAGIKVVTSVSGLFRPTQRPAFKLTQVSYNLTRTVGGNLATLTTQNTQGWTNPNNAISGTNGRIDSVNATFTGNVLAARNGTILLDYANLVNKTELIISSVKLRFYFQTAGTVLNNADVQLKWNKGGADISLATITGDTNASVTPNEYDITSQIASWSDLDNLQTKVLCDSAVSENWTCKLDAIEVEIIASKIDIL
jgi:hypothetical protein